MTCKEHNLSSCPHQWTQQSLFIPTWVRETQSPEVCPHPIPLITPNPTFPNSATLQMCNPLQFEKTSPNTVTLTVSIPAESIITLPTKALEIKMIKKSLKITQNRFVNCLPPRPGIPQDTPKLFLGGFVRKDIQYSEAIEQTTTTVTGIIKDFVVDIPISCVIDFGRNLIFPPICYNQQAEYGFRESTPLPSGLSVQDSITASELTEFNLLSREFYNPSPTCQLLFSQINEMDKAIGCLPLPGGPLKESTFTTIQEKMVILLQLQITFQNKIDVSDIHCNSNKHCNDHQSKGTDCMSIINRIGAILAKLTTKIKGPHVALFLCLQKHQKLL